jgi:hypothetical protein
MIRHKCSFNTLLGQHRSTDHVLQQNLRELVRVEISKGVKRMENARPRIHLF